MTGQQHVDAALTSVKGFPSEQLSLLMVSVSEFILFGP
jgi:hypothetical protein